jgi:hypothetical protein
MICTGKIISVGTNHGVNSKARPKHIKKIPAPIDSSFYLGFESGLEP